MQLKIAVPLIFVIAVILAVAGSVLFPPSCQALTPSPPPRREGTESTGSAPASTPEPTPEPMPEPTPASTPRDHVAICFSGGMRTFDLTWKNLAENVVNAIEPNSELRNVFIEGSTAADCHANKMNVRYNVGYLQECEARARENQASIAKLFQNKEFLTAFGQPQIHQRQLNCQMEVFRAHPCCTSPHAHGFNDDVGVWGFAQYARKQQCIANIREFSVRTGIKFRYALILRPDLHFFDPIPPADYLMNIAPRLLLAPKEQGASIGDYLFGFPWSLADKVDALLHEIFAPRCAQRPIAEMGVSPEYIMERLLNTPGGKIQLPHQVFPLAFSIVRTPTKGECARLENQYVGAGRYFFDTTPGNEGQVISVKDFCNRRFPTAPVVDFGRR